MSNEQSRALTTLTRSSKDCITAYKSKTAVEKKFIIAHKCTSNEDLYSGKKALNIAKIEMDSKCFLENPDLEGKLNQYLDKAIMSAECQKYDYYIFHNDIKDYYCSSPSFFGKVNQYFNPHPDDRFEQCSNMVEQAGVDFFNDHNADC